MAIRITIKGKVHEVGYRLFLLEEADSLFIPCFDARNVKINGKEAIIVLVDGDKEQLEQFIEFVKSNKPENALVEEISVEEFKGKVRDIEKFRASFNTSQLSKIVQVGVKMLGKMDLMLEKQDTMLGKMDLMLQKQDETIKEIKETRVELKKEIKEVKEEVKVISSKLDKTNDLLEKRFERLEQEIERIKKALIKAGIEL
ncbi:MAG: acylphosphatase [Archaeoglobaceae archaeon]